MPQFFSRHNSQSQSDVAPNGILNFPSRPELLRQIALYEASARNAVAAHSSPGAIAAIYANLGLLYKDLAFYPKAEDAMQRSIALLQDALPEKRADEIEQLAILHVALSKLRQAESEQLQVLAIRKATGDSESVALAWNDLAGIYLKQSKFKKAAKYGQYAYDSLGDNSAVSPANRIRVRQTLGSALSGMHNCARGIALLTEAVDLSISNFGENSLLAGVNEYILGISSWHCGNRQGAALWLEHGTTLMSNCLGADHPLYLSAMRQYVIFLRETGNDALAASANSVELQADSVLDARSLTHMPTP